jgi:enoyl-CoA hydratase
MAEFVPVQQRLARTQDAAEGLKSFVEKRPSRFTGR